MGNADNDKKKIKPAEMTEQTLCAEYSAVYRYVLTLCRNAHEAEDITQETFLRALGAKEKFSGGSSLYTWLCTIAKNLLIDRAKKHSRNAGSESLEDMPDNSPSIEERAADRDTAMTVMRALHSIDEPYKEVFSLRVFGQLDFANIGSLFGRTDSWARVTYYRAKEKIKDIMRKEGTL